MTIWQRGGSFTSGGSVTQRSRKRPEKDSRVIGGVSEPETWNRHGKVIGRNGNDGSFPFSFECHLSRHRVRGNYRFFERGTFCHLLSPGTRSTGQVYGRRREAFTKGNKRATLVTVSPYLCCHDVGRWSCYTRFSNCWRGGGRCCDTRWNANKMWALILAAVRLPFCVSSTKLSVRVHTENNCVELFRT